MEEFKLKNITDLTEQNKKRLLSEITELGESYSSQLIQNGVEFNRKLNEKD